MATIKIIKIDDGKPVIDKEVFVNESTIKTNTNDDDNQLYPSDELQEESARLNRAFKAGYL